MENTNIPSATVAARPIRLVIIASSINKFKPIANFLMKRGFSTTATADVKKAMAMIQADPPDFVLISWNIKDAVPSKIADLLVSKLKIHCIAFAEEADAKTAGALASCRVKDIVHAPISGPVLFMRIQKILKAKEEQHFASKKPISKNEITLTIDGDTPVRVTSAAESDIHGKKGSWVSKGSNKGKTIWMFKYEGGRKGENYFYEGDWPPVMNENEIWSLTEGSLFKSQEVPPEDVGAHWIPAEAEKEIKKQIQEDALRYILETLINANSNRREEAPITGKYLGVVEVKSKTKDIQGYLLMGSPQDMPVSELMTHVFKNNIEKSLREAASDLWTEFDFVIHKNMSRFDEWMTIEGRFILEGQYQGQPVKVYFLEHEPIDSIFMGAIDDGKKSLPLDFLRPDEPVTFDVFIKLEKNRKFLKYFKKDTVAHADRIKSLSQNNVKKVYVRSEDWILVQGYEASGHISSEYTKYTNQNPD